MSHLPPRSRVTTTSRIARHPSSFARAFACAIVACCASSRETHAGVSCAFDASTSATWCAYDGLPFGIAVDARAREPSDFTRVDHEMRVTFSSARNPSLNGWVSIGRGASMASATVVVAEVVSGALSGVTVYTLNGQFAPTNVCASSACVVSEAGAARDSTTTRVTFRVREAGAPGSRTFIYANRQNMAWPNKHSSDGTFDLNLSAANAGQLSLASPPPSSGASPPPSSGASPPPSSGASPPPSSSSPSSPSSPPPPPPSPPSPVVSTCALESDGKTWCSSGTGTSGLSVATSAKNASDSSRVDHYVRSTFSGSTNPGANGWASFGPGRTMSSAVVVVGRGGGGPTSTYTLRSQNTPSIICGAGCAVTEASVTQNSSGMTLQFRYTVENSQPGVQSFIWGMRTTSWPGQHRSYGSFSVDLTGTGAGGSSSSSTLKRDVTHGVLMVLVWVIFMPSSTAATLLKNVVLPKGAWFKVHMYGVTIGSIIFVVALGLLLGRPEGSNSSLKNTHSSLALAVVVLWITQYLLGVFRPNKTGEKRLGFIPTSLRPTWFIAHRLIGPTVLIIAAATVITGANLMQNNHGDDSGAGVQFLSPKVVYAMYAVIVAAAIIGAVVDRCCGPRKPIEQPVQPRATAPNHSRETSNGPEYKMAMV